MYDNFLKFYETNGHILFSDELRPAKSITRNIITGVLPFLKYYKETHKLSFDEDVIAKEVLNLQGPSSTSKDNIRNMMEIRFLAYQEKHSGKEYFFTRNFVDFANGSNTLSAHIYEQLKEIKSIWDFTMFYNCILCTLREGVLYGFIVNYPDSYDKFCCFVSDANVRKEMCEKVYKLYGFKGRNLPFGTYTPNAIYRFISTCISLGIVKKDGTESHGMPRYIITEKGHELLAILDSNLS